MSKQSTKKFALIIMCLTMLTGSFCLQARLVPHDDSELIYGNDDRYEDDDYYDQDFVEKARSVAMRVPNKRLSEDRNDPLLINFPHINFKKKMPLICPTERFIDQFSVGDCSGFLIAPNKLVTAGHCMLNESECSLNKWVFDFKEDTTQFKKSNVYSCKRIIAQKNIYNNSEVNDYAVIELDRNVSGRAPLKYRKMGMVHLDTPLVVIGHPLGLPLKITDGGRVSRMNEIERQKKFQSWLLRVNYFTANLDTYAGNSGSPVFNKNTGKVEGILIQGAEDFIFNEQTQCFESRRLSDSYLNSFEKVMRITRVPIF